MQCCVLANSLSASKWRLRDVLLQEFDSKFEQKPTFSDSSNDSTPKLGRKLSLHFDPSQGG